MRVVYLNPHVDDFLSQPPQFNFVNRRALKKYKAVIDGELSNFGCFFIFCDYRISGFLPLEIFQRLPRLLRYLITRMELFLWARINGFEGRVKLLKFQDILKEDVLVGFSYKSARGKLPFPLDSYQKFQAIVFHLSHYFIFTSEKSQNLSRIPNLWLGGDSLIDGHPYFRKHFAWYERPILFLPFGVDSRFRVKTRKRENKCIATGTFHQLDKEIPVSAYRDYIQFFGINNYHPLREKIFCNAKELEEYISCYVRPFRDYSGRGWIKKLIEYFLVSQSSYFALDIVEAYNSYKFAVVDGETTGFPALGIFEAMASGCVPLINPEQLTGYNLTPGLHFLPFDGSKEDLLDTIKRYQNIDLSRISINAKVFADTEMSSTAIANTWRRQLGCILEDVN